MRRASSSRAPYHRVTRLVLWVVIFHVICWWVFNFYIVFQDFFSTNIIRLFYPHKFIRVDLRISFHFLKYKIPKLTV